MHILTAFAETYQYPRHGEMPAQGERLCERRSSKVTLARQVSLDQDKRFDARSGVSL